MVDSTSHSPAEPERRRVVGLIVIALIGLCLLFVVGYVQRLAERDAVTTQIAGLERQMAEAQVRNAVLSNELAQANDNAHVAAIARDSLNLVQEGDQPLILIDPLEPAAPPDSSAATASAPASTQPNWRLWLNLIFGGN